LITPASFQRSLTSSPKPIKMVGGIIIFRIWCSANLDKEYNDLAQGYRELEEYSKLA
jgi:hypothetical protein